MGFEEICRLCAEFCPNQPLTPIDEPVHRISAKLLRCIQINLSVDNNHLLPQSSCENCVEKLEQCWNFFKAVAKAQDKLQLELAVDPLISVKIEEDRAILTAFDDIIEIDHSNACDIHQHDNEETTPLNDTSVTRVPSEIKDEPPEYSDPLGDICSASPEQEAIQNGAKNHAAESSNHEHSNDVDNRKLPMDSSPPRYQLQRNKIAAKRKSCPELITPETVRSFVAGNPGDLWKKVMDYFRMTLDITDEDCNKDGTINERAHPELLQHSWKLYEWKCYKCCKQFDNLEVLERHVEQEHDADSFGMEYCCSDCDKQYDLLASLKNHVYRAHRPVLRFCCDHCGRFYWCMKSLLNHRANINGRTLKSGAYSETSLFECGTCGLKTFTKSALLLHIRRQHSSKRYSCNSCCEEFKTKSERNSHVAEAHTNKYKLGCDICDKKFGLRKTVMEHRKKAHNYFARPVVRILAAAAAAHAVVVDAGNVSVPKSCEICAISFSASRQFHDHMVTHLDKVSYFCNICGQRFKLAGPLKRHLIEHQEGKTSMVLIPKPCHLCDIVLPSYAEFVEHIKIHMNENFTLYKCYVCEKTFKLIDNLKRHLSIHSDQGRIQCDICGRKTTTLHTMRLHMRIHSGTKPYTCEFCGRNFRLSSGLLVHRRKHTGERPYSCTICVPEHFFTRRGNYCVHMTRYHGIDARINVPKILEPVEEASQK